VGHRVVAGDDLDRAAGARAARGGSARLHAHL
jgi:hypothetical protein